ncbi:hypothetical protein M6B38_389825 [Iris pallida]|uniref:Uncharacterized protein n=1 Tax=Iris pallida TaxID=29817 RepID=A0AAX6G0M6_IRIPA|nr:hypothetical protein M6B38_389825 [Iris pallida]
MYSCTFCLVLLVLGVEKYTSYMTNPKHPKFSRTIFMYFCAYPIRSHMLAVFQTLCTCLSCTSGSGFTSCTLFPILYIMYFHVIFLYFTFYVLLYTFLYHDVLVHYLELYFAPLLIGYVAGEMESMCDTYYGRETIEVVGPAGVAPDLEAEEA